MELLQRVNLISLNARSRSISRNDLDIAHISLNTFFRGYSGQQMETKSRQIQQGSLLEKTAFCILDPTSLGLSKTPQIKRADAGVCGMEGFCLTEEALVAAQQI